MRRQHSNGIKITLIVTSEITRRLIYNYIIINGHYNSYMTAEITTEIDADINL